MKTARKIESFFGVFRVIIAVLIAYMISLIALTVISDEPVMAIRQFIVGPFSTIRRFGDMVALATLFTFTGLCMCFMYAVNKFNLSAEGIVIISGCMTTYLGIQLRNSQGNPASRSAADLHPDWDGGSCYPGCFKCQVRRPCGRGIADAELHIILPVSIHFEVWYERRLHAEPRFSQISGRAETGRSCPENGDSCRPDYCGSLRGSGCDCHL